MKYCCFCGQPVKHDPGSWVQSYDCTSCNTVFTEADETYCIYYRPMTPQKTYIPAPKPKDASDETTCK